MMLLNIYLYYQSPLPVVTQSLLRVVFLKLNILVYKEVTQSASDCWRSRDRGINEYVQVQGKVTFIQTLAV